MAITLAPDELSDAEITDGVALGDVGSAARLWVRLWPTALAAARELVEPAEVPGLAAEALIGTLASIAVGRGPREDVTRFVRGAVRELGDDDVPPPARSTASYPDVFTSPTMSRAFARLGDRAQEILWFTVVGDHADGLIAEALGISPTAAGAARVEALTTLQRDYLAAHTDRAEDPACRPAHGDLARVVEQADPAGLSGETWLHLSSCAHCTEAFHELAFSNTAISALVGDAVTAPPVGPSPVDPPTAAEPWAAAPEAPEVLEPEAVRPEALELTAVPLSDSGTYASAEASPGFLRRRGRVVAGAAAVAAAAALALVLAGHGGDDSRALDAAGRPSATPASPAASVPGVASPSLPPTSAATPAATPAGAKTGSTPSGTPTPRVPKATVSSSPSRAPRPTPVSSPTSPVASPTRTPAPTPTPTPTPAPTPTPKPCNALSHLLGLC